MAERSELPKLLVARAVRSRSDFKTATATWIYADGAHHTVYSYAVNAEHLEDFAEIAGVELTVIDSGTKQRDFKNELRRNDLYHALAQGLRGSLRLHVLYEISYLKAATLRLSPLAARTGLTPKAAPS